MQALLVSPDRAAAPAANPANRILLIEPDPVRALRLTHILRTHVRADLEVVGSTADALRALSRGVPDLVLTSNFLPPSDEVLISAELRRTPGAAHVQIVNVPHFVDEDASPENSARRVLSFLSRRTTPGASAYDPATVIDDINAYLGQSHARREGATYRSAAAAPLVRAAPGVLRASADSQPSGQGDADDRRRARRRPRVELPWLCAVKLPWGTEVKVLDISNGGLLVESPLRLVVGSTLDLQLVGRDRELRVPARMIRSEVADVDGLGVRYRAAAAFARDLEIPELRERGTTAPLSPSALGDLLSRVMADVDRGAKPADVRARFERELRDLIAVRDVQLRLTPVIEPFGTESVLFPVLQTAGSSPILQVTFNRDYRPSLMEFRLLKAAASLAAVLLEFAPLEADLVRVTS